MRRKAQISGFTDLQWAGLIIIILLIFVTLAWLIGGQGADQTIKPNNWEASWLATSYAQQPIGNQTLLEALQEADNDEVVDEHLRELLIQTTTSKTQVAFVFASREGKIVACHSKQLREGTTINDCAVAATSSDTAAAPGVYREFTTPGEALGITKRELTSGEPNIQALRELRGSLGVGLVTGLQNTYVGAVVG